MSSPVTPPDSPAAGTASLRTGRLKRPVPAWLLYLLLLVVGTCIVYAGLLPQLNSAVFADNDDSSLFIFWFAHAADVAAGWFGHGSGESNFLYTTSMNHPGGVNGGWNTTVLGIALPMVPVTLLWGPLVSYNLAVMASPVVCSLAAAALARRLMPRWPAFIAGGAYGFSTYVISQSSGHLNLSSAVLGPLVALCLVGLLRGPGSRRSEPRRRKSRGVAARRNTAVLPWPVVGWGALLGLVVGWQFYISTEMLAGAVIAFAVFMIVWMILDWRRFRAGWRRLLGGGAVGVLVAAIMGGPVMLTMFLMPGAPDGSLRAQGVWNTDLLDPVVPGRYTLLGGGETPIPRAMGLDPSEIGGYVGLPWLLVAVFTTVLLWRNPAMGRPVRIISVATLVVFVVSMGSPWYVWGQEVLGITPFRIVELLPVLGNVLPMRLVVYPTLGMALLLGLGLRMLWRAGPRKARRRRTREERVQGEEAGNTPRPTRGRRPVFRRSLAVVAGVAVFATTASAPVPVRTPLIPDFYRGAYAQVIPEGSTVKTLPRPVAGDQPGVAEAMMWQGLTGMHYRETGGYFIGGDRRSPILFMAPNDPLDELMDRHKEDGLPDANSAEARGTVSDLRERGVDFVVVAQDSPYLGYDADELAQFLARAAGTTAQERDGVIVIRLG